MKSTILTGDAIEQLKTIPDGMVNTCVTSPPYYGLRDYGTAEWEGGDKNCDHRFRDAKRDTTSTLAGTSNKEGFALNHYKNVCGKCGAKRTDNQIGLEETPEQYISKLVAVFREVRRVLRDDGTLWVNIGDSYANQKRGDTYSGFNDRYFGRETDGGKQAQVFTNSNIGKLDFQGIKQKDLIGIPWMLAFALRADGWYLRQDIIWHKPNPMPESVTDRCTKSHEYIFLLSKSKQYYYDADAIKEPVSELSLKRAEYGWDCDRPSTKNASLGGEGIHTDKMGTRFVNPDGRNKRSVWTISVNGFKEAHFATFPQALIEPCILAGSPFDGLVLDPFTGSGTTAVTALQNGRNFIGIELNPKYVTMAQKRIKRDGQYQERICI